MGRRRGHTVGILSQPWANIRCHFSRKITELQPSTLPHVLMSKGLILSAFFDVRD